jgi:hypothetical protein
MYITTRDRDELLLRHQLMLPAVIAANQVIVHIGRNQKGRRGQSQLLT